MLEPDAGTGDRNPFQIRIPHSRNCSFRRDDSLRVTLSRIIELNRPLLASPYTFARRPCNRLCYCTDWKYSVVLSASSSVPCFGCKKNIRSTNHKCHVYALFSRDEPLGRHQKPIYDAIRRNNFLQLAKRLPYKLPADVLESSNDVVTACRAVELLDKL